jgi:hypothetical protein
MTAAVRIGGFEELLQHLCIWPLTNRSQQAL